MKSSYKAARLARMEVRQGRRVVVLVPNQTWLRDFDWGREITNLSMPIEGIFVRAASVHSGLLSLRVDTLIVVGDCQLEGTEIAMGMLNIAREPKLLFV